MIQLPTTLPTLDLQPVTKPQPPGSAPRTRADDVEFDALLEEAAADSAPTRELAPEKETDGPSDEAASESPDGASTTAKAPTDEEATDAPAVATAPLAMWQILPTPTPPGAPNPAKIAPTAVNGMGTRIVPPTATKPAAEIVALTTDAPVPLPTTNAAATASVPAGTATTTETVPPPANDKAAAKAAVAPPPPEAALAEAAAEPELPAKSSAELDPSTLPPPTGIPDAKQQRAMTDLKSSSLPALEPAGSAGSDLGGKIAAPAASAPASEQSTSGGDREFGQPGQNSQSFAESNQPGFTISGHEPRPAHEATGAGSTAAAASVDTGRLIQQIEQAIERLRTQGNSQLEMRVPAADGSEILVRLRMEAGELKATFRTESADLREALERGWNQFSTASPERAAKVSAVVFESPSLQNGAGQFNQSPDQRERQQSFADAEALNRPGAIRFSPAPFEPSRPAPSTPVAPRAAEGLQIYA